MINEVSVTTPKETSSSKHRANKINLKKNFDEEKLASGTLKSITIKNINQE